GRRLRRADLREPEAEVVVALHHRARERRIADPVLEAHERFLIGRDVRLRRLLRKLLGGALPLFELLPGKRHVATVASIALAIAWISAPWTSGAGSATG